MRETFLYKGHAIRFETSYQNYKLGWCLRCEGKVKWFFHTDFTQEKIDLFIEKYFPAPIKNAGL
jgi:hypothetical protein